MKIINKFKGNPKKIEWFFKNVSEGNINYDVPDLTSWEIRLIEFYAVCVKQDGISVIDLDCLFKRLHIQGDNIFYETVIVLNRIHSYLNKG